MRVSRKNALNLFLDSHNPDKFMNSGVDPLSEAKEDCIEIPIDTELIYLSTIRYVRDETGEYMLLPTDQIEDPEDPEPIEMMDGRPKYFKNHPSFAYINREKNRDLSIELEKVTYFSGRYLWFKCHVCGYEYRARPCDFRLYKATEENQPHCAHCRGFERCPTAECKICVATSYATHPFSKHCLVDPRLYSAKWWLPLPHKCQECDHNFEISPQDVSRGRNCSYCGSKKRCPVEEDCKWCYDHSAANNSFANQVDDPSVDLRNLYPNDPNVKVRWKCDYCGGHFFNTCNRRMKNPNGGCNKCTYKGEKMMSDFLTENKIDYISQQRYPWCLSNKGNPLIFDFVIESYKLVIEVDGDQHFKDVTNWSSSAESQHDKDIYKMRCLYKKEYSIIRVLQADIFYNKISLVRDLLPAIKKYNQPTMVLIGKGDNLLYSSYKGYTYGDRVHKLV